MPKKALAIPAGSSQVTPYLTVRGAARAIEFYRRAFGAEELMRLGSPDGRIGHAELKIGQGRIMLADEHPEMGVVGPETLGGSSVTIHVYVEDVDAIAARAVAAGATVLRPVENQFYGDRGGKFSDPFGHVWWIATHLEDLSPAEIEKRAAALFGGS